VRAEQLCLMMSNRVYYISEELWGPGKDSTERQKKLQ